MDRVYRLAFRLAGDADLAQDFTQETFIRASSGWGTIEAMRHPRRGFTPSR